MAFHFQDSMVNEYLSEGYLIFRGIVPPSLLTDLRQEAEKARDLAHKLNGPPDPTDPTRYPITAMNWI